ncbi:ThiF family adenylyltransferase [Psychrobacillus sp. FSL W7-1457]|uniref:ThiF family adenylyltransferase n=1 Tax=Psychrobacillus sp. FSL W7-1457 TaxID=2954547 RepID=UPI00315A8391
MISFEKYKIDLESSFSAAGYEFIEDKIDNIKSTRANWVKTYKLQINLERKILEIRIALSIDFPIEKPYFFFENVIDFNFMPHIEKSDNLICYAFDDGLILDVNYPVQIIMESLNLAIKTISNGMNKSRFEEFKREYEINWSRLDNTVEVQSFFDDRDIKIKEVEILKPKNSLGNETRILINPEVSSLRELSYIYEIDLEKWDRYKCVFITLKNSDMIPFPNRYKMWNFKQLKRLILRNCGSSTKRYLQNIKFNNEELYFILSVPFEKQRINVGVCVYPANGSNKEIKLANISNKSRLTPVRYTRIHADYLMKRTQGKNAYENYKVLILGLGSIGSNTLANLAKMGVKYFGLVDNDILLPENSMRHFLGLNHILMGGTYKFKTDILSLYLKSNFTEVEVEKFTKNVKNFIDDNLKELSTKYDLIVSALGSPTYELYLNDFIYKNKINIPIIYSWIEPLGIGSHILVTNNSEIPGCFRCLYTEEDNLNRLVHNRGSFVNPEDNYLRKMQGCHSEFTPYSYLDSQEISINLSKIILEVMNNKFKGNKLISYLGDSRRFTDEGFEPSLRYKQISLLGAKTNTVCVKQNECVTCGVNYEI